MQVILDVIERYLNTFWNAFVRNSSMESSHWHFCLGIEIECDSSADRPIEMCVTREKSARLIMSLVEKKSMARRQYTLDIDGQPMVRPLANRTELLPM